jgi:hypothetical protein
MKRRIAAVFSSLSARFRGAGFCLLIGLPALKAQTMHPLLIAALDSAERVPHGSYRIRAIERHAYSRDTIFYRGEVSFMRFEHFDGRPGLRYEAHIETQYPTSRQQLRVVFDGRYKYTLYGDSLAQRYDLQRLDLEAHQFQHGSVFFFIPLLLHTPAVRKYYGQSQELGVPPYQTLGDTLVGQALCTLVGADWTAQTGEEEELRWRQVRFGIDKRSGLPIYFRYRFGRVGEPSFTPPPTYLLEIVVETYTSTLPRNNFYLDWQALPKTFEVREFYDCYNREILRPRQFEGL